LVFILNRQDKTRDSTASLCDEKVGAMQEKIKNILSNLKSAQEDLLALSDDLWLEIDHNDNDAIRNGVAFKEEFNLRNNEFTASTNALSELIQNYTNTPLYTPEKPQVDRLEDSDRERVIKELNKKSPHNLNEEFKYKRPYGFVIQGVPYENKLTWSELYLQVCAYLLTLDKNQFISLDNNPNHISKRNNKYFSSNQEDLRSPQKCGNTIFVEMNLSANQIRDSMKRLLRTYHIFHDDFTIYLREDRDA
jgi:hypothetical protein